MKKIIYLLLILFLITSAISCLKNDKEKKIIIAEQYGLAYAPLQIIRIEKMLEKRLPGWTVEWKKLANTAAIREAMLSENLDIGFMGLPPFLIGFDRGMKWKMFTGLCRAPIGLVTWKDKISSISGLSPKDRIALPQPGSIQHILLAMASEKIKGSASYFDNQIVTMSHPDGMNALFSKKDITAHFTSPPFIMKELKQPGFKMILSGKEAMGSEYTFIGGTVKNSFAENNKQTMEIIRSVISESIDFINNNPGKAAELLSPLYKIDKLELKNYLTWEGMVFSGQIEGMDKFISFMTKNNYLKNRINNKDIYYK